MIKYLPSPELKEKCAELASKLGFSHLDFERIAFIRSAGSKSRRTIARCYALGKVWQHALDLRAHYVVEVLSERFDKLNEDEKTKTLIHEMMHIPKAFGGGFRQHDFVCNRNVEVMFKRLKNGE